MKAIIDDAKRTYILQRREAGATLQQIGDELGVTKEAIRQHIVRAQGRLEWHNQLSTRLKSCLLQSIPEFSLDMWEQDAIRLLSQRNTEFYLRLPYFGPKCLNEMLEWLARWDCKPADPKS